MFLTDRPVSRAGLICLDLFKALQGKPVEAYRNTFANLALPLFAMAEPIPPKAVEFNGMKWTLWERWILDGDLTVQQVIDWFAVRQVPSSSSITPVSRLFAQFNTAQVLTSIQTFLQWMMHAGSAADRVQYFWRA